MNRKLFIEKTKELAVDFWAMALNNGTFESHFEKLLNEYETHKNILPANDLCNLCNGDGWVADEFIAMPCPSCGGRQRSKNEFWDLTLY